MKKPLAISMLLPMQALAVAAMACNLVEVGKYIAPQDSPARAIPAGTYRGQFPWNANSISTLDENEITIAVSSSGEVSGEARFKYHHTDSHNQSGGGQCTSYYEFWETYTLSGQVAGLDDKSV